MFLLFFTITRYWQIICWHLFDRLCSFWQIVYEKSLNLPFCQNLLVHAGIDNHLSNFSHALHYGIVLQVMKSRGHAVSYKEQTTDAIIYQLRCQNIWR